MFAVLCRNLILICILLSLISLAPGPALAQITNLDFGSVAVGQPKDQVLTKTLYLSGIYTSATIGTPYITGPDKADFQITQNGFTGGPYHNGAMLSVTITFTPSRTGSEQATLDGSGTLQPGNAPLTFVPVTLTGTGVAPPPPPVTISAAKLGLPSTARKTGGLSCTYSAYFQGQGTGDISGQWMLDQNPIQSNDLGTMTLSAGNWVQVPAVTIPFSSLQGVHTVKFVFNGTSNASTSGTESHVSGFDPLSDGWSFNNFSNSSTEALEQQVISEYPFYSQLALDGVCIGMTRTVLEDYNAGKHDYSVPRTARVLSNIVEKQAGGFSHAFFHVLPRMALYSDGNSALAAENSLVFNQLSSGVPCVVPLYQHLPRFVLNHVRNPSHAVVAFAAFYAENAYVEATPNTSESITIYLVYDPNDEGKVNTIGVINNNSVYSMNYDGYQYLSLY